MVHQLLEVFRAFKQEIQPVLASNLNLAVNSKTGIEISCNHIHSLRCILRDNKFPTIEEEIHFFKVVKPFLHSHIIFFSKIFNYQLHLHPGSIEKKRNYIDSHIEQNKQLICRDSEFLGYYRTSDVKLDQFYFVRGHDKLVLISDPSFHFTDPDFSTSHDNSVAQIIAYDLIQNYLNNELHDLRMAEIHLNTNVQSPAILNDLSWTASKTDLVEMIYALQASGAIRDGEADIKKMQMVCEKLFNLELGNVYKTYLEIKSRKTDKTSFLTRLKYNLELKIKKEEENY